MMKKYIAIALILLNVILLFSCSVSGGTENLENGAKMTAIIKNIDEKIEIEVISGDYGVSGIYWVNVGSETVYLGKNGNRIFKSTLKVGDTVEITYGGQVMMSYPPQIVAKIIQIK